MGLFQLFKKISITYEVHSKYLYKVGKEKSSESIKGNALGFISHSKTTQLFIIYLKRGQY